jgi:hypothetical protein
MSESNKALQIFLVAAQNPFTNHLRGRLSACWTTHPDLLLHKTDLEISRWMKMPALRATSGRDVIDGENHFESP